MMKNIKCRNLRKQKICRVRDRQDETGGANRMLKFELQGEKKIRKVEKCFF
jgi:hypothetical protein